MVQRLRHHASKPRGTVSISGQGSKIPLAVQCSQKMILKNKIEEMSKQDRLLPLQLHLCKLNLEPIIPRWVFIKEKKKRKII